MTLNQIARMSQQRVKDLEAAFERVAFICADPAIKRATKLRELVAAEAHYARSTRLAVTGSWAE